MEKKKMKNVFAMCIIALVLSSMSALAYKPLADTGILSGTLPVYTMSEPIPSNPPVIIEPILPPVRTCPAYQVAEGCKPSVHDRYGCPLPPVCTAKDLVLKVGEFTSVGEIRIGLLSTNGIDLLSIKSMPPRELNSATISLSPRYSIHSLGKPMIITLAVGQKTGFMGYTIKLVKVDHKTAYFAVVVPQRPKAIILTTEIS